MRPNIEVCLTPDALRFETLTGKIVVVIDILRATSCMVTALAHGIKSIIPVQEIEEARALQAQGYIAGAERGGQRVEGFELDNSPFSYQNPDLKGKTLALTTSNGTQAIKLAQAQGAAEVIVGAFLNRHAISNYLRHQKTEVMLLCAGWQNRPSLEDTFFAGAVISDLLYDRQFANDNCVLARATYHTGHNNYLRFLSEGSHYQRLHGFSHERDIQFCLTENLYEVLPVMQGNELVLK